MRFKTYGAASYLNFLVQSFEYIINLILETSRQHFISLIEDKNIDTGGP